MTAEVFAPGIISTDAWELEGVFAPGMREFYFVTDRGAYTKPTIIGFRFEDNEWKKFTEFRRTGEPFISADGTIMHLAKGYRERTDRGWSDVKRLGPLFQRDDWGIMRLTASSTGTYVFDDYKSGDVIRISRLVDGVRQPPQKMSEQINRGKFTAHPFIAPDESYLIWDSERDGGLGGSDLYISFKQEDGTWGPAINMGEKVNSEKDDFFASVTPDGRFLMFDRTIGGKGADLNVDIYWVDARVIEELRASVQASAQRSERAKMGDAIHSHRLPTTAALPYGLRVKGPLSQRAFDRGFKPRKARLRKCYERYAPPSRAAYFGARFIVGPDGRVAQVSVHCQAVAPRALVDCLEGELRSLRFSRPTGRALVTVTYPQNPPDCPTGY